MPTEPWMAGYISKVNTIQMRCNILTFLVTWYHWHQHHMIPMALLMPHDTYASTNINTSTRGHITPVDNHLNKINKMVSLIPLSGSHDRKHSFAKHGIANCMQQLLFPSNFTHKPHVLISSSTMKQLCQYIFLIWTKCNQKQTNIHFTLLAYAPEQMCLWHCTYMIHCTTTVVFIETQHYCTYAVKKKNLHRYSTYLPNMSQEQKCPSNVTCMPHM